MSSRIPVRSRRQAMDWSLALISQGITSTIDQSDAGWALIVDTQEHESALWTLAQYRAENRFWPWRRKLREQVLFDWGSLAWVILVCLFFWIDTQVVSLRGAGVMDAAAVSHGQWWRLFTAIFLHADAGHLAANATIGLLLLGLAMGRYGTGIGLLAAYLAGVGGNLTTWLIFGNHLSLGASGMVMGCLGLIAADPIIVRRRRTLPAKPTAANGSSFGSRQEPIGTSCRPSNPRAPLRHFPLKSLLSAIAGGVLLFVLLGLNPDSDVLAHLGGFVCGLVLGLILAGWPRLTQSAIANLAGGLLFSLGVTFSWWAALAREFH